MSQHHTVAVTFGVTPELEALIGRLIDASQTGISAADKALLDGVLLRAAGITDVEEALAAQTPSPPPLKHP
jgi:hypothetical protein